MTEFSFRNLAVKLFPEGGPAPCSPCTRLVTCPTASQLCRPCTHLPTRICGPCTDLVTEVCDPCTQTATFACGNCTRLPTKICGPCTDLVSVICDPCTRFSTQICGKCTDLVSVICDPCTTLVTQVCGECTDFATCLRGTIICPGDSIVCPVDTRVCPVGTEICPGGSILCNGSIWERTPVEVRAELAELKQHLQQVLADVESKEAEVAAMGKPSTVEEIDQLKDQLLAAVAELDEERGRIGASDDK